MDRAESRRWGDVMTLLEFAAAAVIASYAMIGGALFSSAITKPRNCIIVLDRLIPIVRNVGYALVVVVFLGALFFGRLSGEAAFPSPVDIIAAAHMSLLALLYLSRWIAQSLPRD